MSNNVFSVFRFRHVNRASYCTVRTIASNPKCAARAGLSLTIPWITVVSARLIPLDVTAAAPLCPTTDDCEVSHAAALGMRCFGALIPIRGVLPFRGWSLQLHRRVPKSPSSLVQEPHDKI